jgi:hypothetical protein
LVGGAFGLASGGLAVGSSALQAGTVELKAMMSEQLVKYSGMLLNEEASQAVIVAVQTGIVQGMGRLGYSTANVVAAIAALDALGVPITEEALKVWIDDDCH